MYKRQIHTIFPGDLLKFLDGRVCDLDIGDPLILTNELLEDVYKRQFSGHTPSSSIVTLSDCVLPELSVVGGVSLLEQAKFPMYTLSTLKNLNMVSRD